MEQEVTGELKRLRRFYSVLSVYSCFSEHPFDMGPPGGWRARNQHGTMIDIAITNRQDLLSIDADQLSAACRMILSGDGHRAAAVSLTVVDDDEMHALNREHLDHDYPTDVLSFPLSDPGEMLVGEVIVSAARAINNATEYGNRVEDELLLYVVHGTLHLVGLGDKTTEDAKKMRQAEAYWLAELGVADDRIPRLVYVDDRAGDDQSIPEGEPTR